MVAADALAHISGLTLIPGIEWTHYKGHANFTGVDRPYDGPFAANTPKEVAARFAAARARGALITINHPFDELCPFRFDIHSLPFDCVEIWNGPMRAFNLQAIGWWHSLLAARAQNPRVRRERLSPQPALSLPRRAEHLRVCSVAGRVGYPAAR